MEELKIDEDNITAMIKTLSKIQQTIQEDKETLQNKSEDIFTRYMSFIRMGFIINNINLLFRICMENMSMGHAIWHEALQSKVAKENGWNGFDIENNPFFYNEERNKKFKIVDGNGLPEQIKELIREHVDKEALKAEQNETVKH